MRVILRSIMGGIAGARWQDDAQLHVTLRFVGEVPRPHAEDIAAALDRIVFPHFDIALSGVGSFADARGRLNSLWAGIAPRDAITRLHHKVDRAVSGSGVPRDTRAYLPHVTLARGRLMPGSADDFLRDHAALTSEPATIEHLILFESTLGGEGARYETIVRYPLGQ